MNKRELRNLFVRFNISVFLLVLIGFNFNMDNNNSKKALLCFKYANKKCKFKSKDKAKLICNTLVSHNNKISGITHHRDCRKDL